MNRRIFLKTAAAGLGSMAVPVVPVIPAMAAKVPSTRIPLLDKARAALATHEKRIAHRDIIGIADYSRHSGQPRFHLVDLVGGRHTSLLVAHGKGSDRRHTGWLQHFSNISGSEASSRGAFVTTNAYVGKHGRSHRLAGLEAHNDLAEARAIVIHGAWYVDPKMVKTHGKIGRSQGCFAFAKEDLDTVLTRLGSGRLLYADKA